MEVDQHGGDEVRNITKAAMALYIIWKDQRKPSEPYSPP
jgi:hypothetical protein